MRTFKISLLVFILSITVSAQWYQQNSGTTNPLAQVLFVNDQIGWTTYFLDIYKTTNGGENWQYLYTQNPIFQFSFSNELIGWMRTWTTGSTLLKTVDGGENWIPVYSYFGATDYINDFEFINQDTGWFVGEQTISLYEEGITEFPIIFKETTDGGITWVDKNFTSNHPGGLREIESIDYLNLIVAGWDTLFRTTNGGIDWQKRPLPQSGDNVIQFIDMNIGWARGSNINGGILFKTTDGGNSWVQQVQPIGSYQFINLQIGWYTNSNQIYSSTDGGYSWTLQNSNTNNSLNDIFFIDSNNGWVVGQNGTILHTINGGIPVELISFTATSNVSEVILNWLTATETNNSGFEILRSLQNDSDEWKKIGFVPGQGTTTEAQHYTFTDNDVKPGKHQYKLKQIDYNGTFEYSQIVEVEIPFVNEFSLSQNYPNPFNPITVISYQLPISSDVVIKVFDVLGNEIATLVNEEKSAGSYVVEFSASALPSGVYFYQLKTGEYTAVKKMILMK